MCTPCCGMMSNPAEQLSPRAFEDLVLRLVSAIRRHWKTTRNEWGNVQNSHTLVSFQLWNLLVAEGFWQNKSNKDPEKCEFIAGYIIRLTQVVSGSIRLQWRRVVRRYVPRGYTECQLQVQQWRRFVHRILAPRGYADHSRATCVNGAHSSFDQPNAHFINLRFQIRLQISSASSLLMKS